MHRHYSTFKLPMHRLFSTVNVAIPEDGIKRKSVVPRRSVKSTAPEVKLRTNPVVAVCTAESYDFDHLHPFLQKHYGLAPSLAEDVLHVPLADADAEVFIFRNGSFVVWSPPNTGAFLLELREQLRPFEVNPTNELESEEMSFRTGNGDHSSMHGEMIVLGSNSVESVRAKLAFSNGLSDSVKLAVLESMMEDNVQRVRPIPDLLQQKGKVPMSRQQVLGLTGQLLHFRAQLNLYLELIDPPELYWSEPELEHLYNRISRALDTKQRVSILNKKLDYVSELAGVLRSHLSEQHGLKLEWGIIALIAVEVAFETLHLFTNLSN